MKRCAWISFVLGIIAQMARTEPELKSLVLEMPGTKPKQDNFYMCVAVKVPDGEHYVVHFEPQANASIAHHVLLYGCDEPWAKDRVWECGQVCGGDGDAAIIYAWAKNAHGLDLPKDTGFRIGDRLHKWLVLQVHYAKAFKPDQAPDHTGMVLKYTPQPQPYLAGIYILMAYSANIPAHQKAYELDISCRFPGNRAIYPFAFRTHAHKLGTSIGGYMNNGSWYIIGEGSPKIPQAFYPVNTTHLVIKPHDLVSGRCTYNSMSQTKTTGIGGSSDEEMCNFYIMFNTPNTAGAKTYYHCGGNRYYDLLTDRPDRVRKNKHEVVYDAEWAPAMKLGQVSGVSTDSHGHVWIFHRASRTWTDDSFDLNNVFNVNKYGPIPENVIAQVDGNGKVLQEFGANMFYMPHGIHVDHDDNIWVTDVGLHQVMMFPAGQTKPALVLGEKLKPGSDDHHFCEPTDVAITKNGELFVADGYCNHRVMKFKVDKDNKYKLVKQWGESALDPNTPISRKARAGAFNIVHSITLAEDKGLVCVADREDGRIQCFDLDGNFKEIIEDRLLGDRLFAAAYHPRDGGTLYVVNGPEMRRKSTKVGGFTVDINTGEVVQAWAPTQGLSNPHCVTVCHRGAHVYVGEISPNRVWRFSIADPDDQGRLRLNKSYRKGGKLSLVQLLTGKHRGFDPLSTEESDELEHLSDSETEDYSNRPQNIQHT